MATDSILGKPNLDQRSRLGPVMVEFKIRPLQLADHEAAARLFHDAWHETQAPLQDPRVAAFRDMDYFRLRLVSRADRTLIATCKGHLGGLVVWTGNILNSLFVAASARNKGMGAKLCAAAENEMRVAGHNAFQLYCVVGNGAARRFYERNGWNLDRLDESGPTEVSDGTANVSHWIMVKHPLD